MALISCIECGKEFSDKAKACPNCGCPIEYIIEMLEKQQVQQEVPVHSEEDCMPMEVTEDTAKQAEPQLPPYAKENLLSYSEMRNFAFSSILPYINKELNGTITDVKRGTGEKDDAHYYVFCGRRIIGIKVVLDAYPDIYNVGRFFDDDINEQEFAKSMHEHGFECAVARIGIGASDPMRFARRIFLRNDGYYFNYEQLRFVKHNPQASNGAVPSGIRFSLSEAPKDESWKKIVGFKYTKPSEIISRDAMCSMAIQRTAPPKDYAKIRATSAFWDDEEMVLGKVELMCKNAYISAENACEMSQLICYAASTAHNKISPEEMLNYVCNAVDFITGVFLSDSVPVPQNEMLIALRDLFEKTELSSKYEVECDEAALINHLVYIFVTDRQKFREFLQSDYLAEHKGKRLSSIGYIYHCTKDKFLANPKRFGYGQDVVDEIARLQNMNSPQNLQKYAAMRVAVEAEMRQFCVLHEKIVAKKTLQLLGKTEEDQLRQFSKNAYELLKFAENNFDEKLADTDKRSMASFGSIIAVYQRCLGMDEVIISRQLRGKYGLFERMDDVKESKTRFEQFVLQQQKCV